MKNQNDGMERPKQMQRHASTQVNIPVYFPSIFLLSITDASYPYGTCSSSLGQLELQLGFLSLKTSTFSDFLL